MVCLARCKFVEVSEVAGSARGAIMLSYHHHTVLPGGRSVQGDPLDDTQLAVSVKTCFHGLLPVDGDSCRNMDSHWLSIGIKVEFEWRAALKIWQLLLFTVVEG